MKQFFLLVKSRSRAGRFAYYHLPTYFTNLLTIAGRFVHQPASQKLYHVLQKRALRCASRAGESLWETPNLIRLAHPGKP
ncbi:hypothetical protein ERD84_15690 [Pollutimonas harenae]|nr:hypothetical protein ERD84_15690 [Pollutimonas harenae]